MKPVVSATPLKLVWGALFILAACSVESGQIRTRVNEAPGFQTSATSRAAPLQVSGVRVFNPEERTINHIQRSLAFFPGQRANNFQTGVICGEDGIFAASAEDCEGPRDVYCLSRRSENDPRCIDVLPCDAATFTASERELRGLCGAVVRANLRGAYNTRDLSGGRRGSLSGRGISVGVMDGAFGPDHPEFNPAGTSFAIDDEGIITLTLPLGNGVVRTIESDNTPTVTVTEGGTGYEFESLPNTPLGHGTAVIGLIAAPKDDLNHPFNIQGIAYESNIVFRGISRRFALSRPQRVADLPEPSGNSRGLRQVSEIANRVAAEIMKEFTEGTSRVPIVNLSVTFFPNTEFGFPDTRDLAGNPGTPGDPNDPTLPAWTEATIDPHLGSIAATMAQTGTALANRTIFVWAAGNSSLPNPAASSALPYLYRDTYGDMDEHVIAVINVRQGARSRHVTPGRLSRSSNSCGLAADFCIAAPGSQYGLPTLGGLVSDNVWADERGFGFGPFGGTSASAPVVAATLALMFEAFGPGTMNNLGADEIVDRLYETANKDGIYSRAATIDARFTEDTGDTGMVANPNEDGVIYGQGLLDIGAAVAVSGVPTIRTSLGRARARLSDTARFSPDETGIFTSPALGDALSRALGSREAAFFDSLDTAFPFSAQALGMAPARTRRALDSLGRRVYETEYGTAALMPFDGLGQKADGLSLTLQGRGVDMAVRYNAPLHLALAPAQDALRAFPSLTGDYFDLVREGAGVSLGMDITRGTSATATFFSGHASDAQNLRGEDVPDARGAHLAYRVQGDAYTLQLEAGYLMESDQILGIYPQGLFAHEGTTPTFFAGVAGAYEFGGNWQGLFHARMGRTEPDALNATQSGLHNITRVASSSFSAGLYRRNLFAAGDGFGIIVAQPLRIEDGSAELTYATGRTREKILLEETLKIPLTPSGRAVDIEAVYHWKRLAFSAGATLNAGHERGKADAHISARFAKRF